MGCSRNESGREEAGGGSVPGSGGLAVEGSECLLCLSREFAHGMGTAFQIGQCGEVFEQALPCRARVLDAACQCEDGGAFGHPRLGAWRTLLHRLHPGQRRLEIFRCDFQSHRADDKRRDRAELVDADGQHLHSFLFAFLCDQGVAALQHEIGFRDGGEFEGFAEIGDGSQVLPEFRLGTRTAGQGLRVLRMSAKKSVQQWQRHGRLAGFEQRATAQQIQFQGRIEPLSQITIRQCPLPILVLAAQFGTLRMQPRILR